MKRKDLSRILCARCLKRQLGKITKKQSSRCVAEAECQLCRGLFKKIPEVAKRAIQELNTSGEIKTFQVGTSVPRSIEAFEEKIWDTIDISNAECIKAELNRELGKEIEKNSGYTFDPIKPHARILWDTRGVSVYVSLSPLFLFGKYKKLKRFIRQTKKENSTEESVEELIGKIIKEATKGEITFHGSGREDVDALMLGEGRPFIIEVSSPKIRTLDLKRLEKKINNANKGKIEVNNLRFAEAGEIEIIKRAKFNKTYEAIVALERKVTSDDVRLINSINECKKFVIHQRTPTRVLDRRVDIVRKKRIIAVDAKKIDDKHIRLFIKAESGTYIKEFINGDNGRTTPSISEMIGTRARCVELNVLKVHSEWYEDWW